MPSPRPIARLTGFDPKHAGKVHLVGNPVRAEVLALRDRAVPRVHRGWPAARPRDRRQPGARVLSEVVPDGLSPCCQPALRNRLQVTQQCRPRISRRCAQRYAAHEIPAELGTYFEDMAERLADAHLFIGRAGASTMAELTAVGRPAILVPLPIATDDHQACQHREMCAAGGARIDPAGQVHRCRARQADPGDGDATRNAGQRRPRSVELRLSQCRAIWPIWSKALAGHR
jgi:UDP-N-acetylglucosamine--N-acetylmuramyl-(pentapeptide) pyrophosphoryl-undecaprenol N-acetylglucosamine transferase